MDDSKRRLQSGHRAGCGVERRLAHEFRVAGRTLMGSAMVYGDTSPDFNERFLSGAFGEVRSVPLNLQHDPGIIVAPDALLTDTPRALRVRADLPEGSGALDLVKRGALNGFSVEFQAQSERREAGVRVIERAKLTGLALVDRGAYPGARAEVRARSGRTLRQRIPANRNLSCKCSGRDCALARWANDALAQIFDEGFEEAAEILAVKGSYGEPLASKSRGTVRSRVDGDEAVIEIDLPVGPDGDAVLRAVENTGAVTARPYFDPYSIIGTVESPRAAGGGNVMVYQSARIRSFIVGATDAREGWPVPELVPTPGMEIERAAPDPDPVPQRRRRLWL